MARHITIVSVTYNQSTSDPDRRELQAKISAKTAVVYFESPSYLGGIDREGAEMARTACAHRAETIISADATGRCQGRNCPWSDPNSVALPNDNVARRHFRVHHSHDLWFAARSSACWIWHRRDAPRAARLIRVEDLHPCYPGPAVS